MSRNPQWDSPAIISKRRDYPFVSLQNDINQLFNSLVGDLQIPILSPVNQNIIPAVDIIENAKGYKVEAELPGMDQDDIEVTVTNNCVVIKGEKSSSSEDRGENYLNQERYYGSCQRTIALPDEADTEKANATFKKGVLWIEIPKKPEAITKSRKLEIKKAS